MIEPVEIIQSRKLLDTGQINQAITVLEIKPKNEQFYNALLLSEQASIYLFHLRNPSKAVKLIYEAWSMVETNDYSNTYVIHCLINKSEILLHTNNLINGLEDANLIYDSSALPVQKAIGEYLISFGNFQKGNLHLAKEFAASAVEKLQHTENISFYLKSLITLGNCFKTFGELNKSLEIFEKAEIVAKTQIPNIFFLSTILQTIGELKLNLGEYKQAERYLKSCESLIFNNMKNLTVKADLGELYYLQGDIEKAVSFILTSYKEAEKNDPTKPYALNTLGKIYRRIGKLKESKLYYEEAIEIIQRMSFSLLHATILINYAQTIILLHEIDVAFEVILKVKAMAVVHGHQSIQAKILNTEGMYFATLKQFELAKQIFMNALDHAKAQNNYFDIIECFLFIAEINLEIYKQSKDDLNFLYAKDSIENAYKLALIQKIIPTINKIRILKAIIHSSEMNFGLALDQLKQAKKDAETKHLLADLEDISRIYNKINSQLPQLASQEINVNSIIGMISRFTDSSIIPGLLRNQISLVTFKFTERGPMPFYYSENMNKDENFNLQLITTIGVLLISVLGQGNAFFSGLFGPIPVKQLPDQLVLAYTSLINDEDQTDRRLNKSNYALITIIFPKFADDYMLFNRKTIQAISEEFVLENPSLQSWNESSLNNLYAKLLYAFDIKEEQ